MQYSHLLLALPLASAVILDRRDPNQYAPAVVEEVVTVQATEVKVATEVVTVTVGPGGETPNVKADVKKEDGKHGFQNAGDAPWAGRYRGGHQRAHKPKVEQPPPPVKEEKVQPPPPAKEEKVQPPPPAKEEPKQEAPKVQSSSNGGGGCPPDTSGNTSEGVNGSPARSMIDSINEIRRMYNPNAPCLQWSNSLAKASTDCAATRSESSLRANSGIVSDPGYDTPGNQPMPLAKTKFEASMYLMLCQAPDDPQMQGKCPFKTGEIGCSSGPCQGHRDMVVDDKGEFRFMGAACNAAQRWMSASFSKTNEIFD